MSLAAPTYHSTIEHEAAHLTDKLAHFASNPILSIVYVKHY